MLSKRVSIFNYYKKLFNLEENKEFEKKKFFSKNKLLGEGDQGKVYKYEYKHTINNQTNDKNIAIKKLYLEKADSKYIYDIYNKKALKLGVYIEFAASQLLNQLVLQSICPNFVLNYGYDFVQRNGICSDIYPYTAYHYNEYINSSTMYTDWVQIEHSIDLWYNAFFQIIISIYCMQKYFNMTHLDLHSDNIFVKQVKAGGYWIYIINNKEYKIQNLGYIFYIGDLGHAWIPNILKSWFISEKYKNKLIYKNFDLERLFKSTLKISTSPKDFKTKIKYMIKTLKSDKISFIDIITEIWDEKYVYDNYGNPKELNSDIIDIFNLDKKLIVDNIPYELRNIL